MAPGSEARLPALQQQSLLLSGAVGNSWHHVPNSQLSPQRETGLELPWTQDCLILKCNLSVIAVCRGEGQDDGDCRGQNAAQPAPGNLRALQPAPMRERSLHLSDRTLHLSKLRPTGPPKAAWQPACSL